MGSQLGFKVVAVSGCFDRLTPGHVDFLRRARAMGDMLVVLLYADEGVTRLHGGGHPINTLMSRILVLRELRCVDLVIPFSELSPWDSLKILQPEWYVKIRPDSDAEAQLEREFVDLWGGHLVYLLPGPTSGIAADD
jgi:rfaE bifunctional protein nucleotidyltransferase chain/domain